VAEFVPTFLGSVMKAIACTPNKNFDNDAYDKGVIEPARKIRRLQEQLGDAKPTPEQMREVMELLLLIFETKFVDMDEREDRVKEILDRNHVHDVFPNLLPLRRSAGR
jgi:[acyl-carrier-protein] S-malonyltransferase